MPTAMAEMLGRPRGELAPGDVTAQRITVDPMCDPVGPPFDFSELAAEEAPGE